MIRAIYMLSVRSLLLTGSICAVSCSGMLTSDTPADKVYWLEPLIVQKEVIAESIQPSLVVFVSAAPGLDTDRLLILGPGARLNHYALARWPDNIPEVLESLLRTTLESTGRYSRVTAGTMNRSADWALELEVRELYTLATQSDIAHTARMVLNGYIVCPQSEQAIALQAAIGIDDNRLGKIVAAYQLALNEVSRQLVDRLANACSNMNAQPVDETESDS